MLTVRRCAPLALLFLAGPAAAAARPIVYTVRVPAPETHVAEIEALVPVEGRQPIELMMATWTPGFYKVEDYAGRITELNARTREGAPVAVEKARPNRWRLSAGRARSVTVTYRLACEQRSVTTNWISPELAVLNGAATFLTLADGKPRPHEVRLVLPAAWKGVATALRRAGAEPHHYRALDFDSLVDSPIVAGELDVHGWSVGSSRHELVDVGERTAWDGPRAARDLERMTGAAKRLWGSLPFERYVFLNVFRQGGGGLEHKDSTLLTANPKTAGEPAGYRRWLPFATHEYVHAFNVKRLRPIELGPFDYEKAPTTRSLWISEGLTNYYAELLLSRAGLRDQAAFLASLSAQIASLQKQPGRLLQTVEESSLEVWTNSLSGVNPSEKTVSYYVKGHVIGFLLDARIRRATRGRKSLDDAMRLACERYAGARGFTAAEFEAVVEKIAGTRLRAFFDVALRSTNELDYTEALDWYGLRFASGDGIVPWTLETRPEPKPDEALRLRALLEAP